MNMSILKLTSHIGCLLAQVILVYGRTRCGFFLVWTPLSSQTHSFDCAPLHRTKHFVNAATCLIYITERKEGDAHSEVGNPTNWTVQRSAYCTAPRSADIMEEWNMCLPANLSLLKALLVMVCWKTIVRFTTTQEHVMLGVRIIRLHLALHQPTKLLCNQTYTISWLICGIYILDQGHSHGNRFTVPVPLQNDICDLFKFFRTENTWNAGYNRLSRHWETEEGN